MNTPGQLRQDMAREAEQELEYAALEISAAHVIYDDYSHNYVCRVGIYTCKTDSLPKLLRLLREHGWRPIGLQGICGIPSFIVVEDARLPISGFRKWWITLWWGEGF